MVDRVQVSEAFDFDRVAKGVHEKHGPLLTRLPGKAQMRLDHKTQTAGLQAFGQGLPITGLQDQAKVRHGHQLIAHAAGVAGLEGLSKMQRNLVREKIKIHPGVGGSSFLAAEHTAVKTAGFVQVGDMKGKVKQAAHASKHSSHRAFAQQGQT